MFNDANNISRFVNCSDPKATHVGIYTPMPSFGVTVFGAYFLPIIVILGITGNIISLIILSRTAKTISSHFYLWWMAVFDIMSLLTYIPSFWAVIIMRPYYYYVIGPEYPATWVEYVLLGRYVCQTRMFITFTSRTCSVYTIVLVTVERLIMVVYPMKSSKICTIFSAKISVLVMITISFLINIPWFFAFKIIPKPCFPLGICVANDILMVNRMVEFIILCLIPCITIIICNSCIIYTLRGRIRLSILVNSNTHRKQEREITLRLLAVSFVFFFLTIPSLVVICIHTAHQATNDNSYLKGREADAFVLSIILFAINLAINFVIYCLTGRNFRTAALALIKCNWEDMRKYSGYLGTETTSANTNDRIEMTKSGDEHSNIIDDKDSALVKKHFKDKKKLLSDKA